MLAKNIFSKQLLSYMLVGAVATTIDTLLFGVFVTHYSLDYRLSLLCSFCVSVFVNFLLCDYFIFTRTLPFWQSCARHYTVRSGGLVLNQCCMIILVTLFKKQHLVACRIVVSACTFIVNFLLVKLLSFKELEHA